MAETMEKTREQELLEEFTAGLDPDGAAALAARVAAIEENATEKLLAAGQRADAAEARADAAEAALAKATAKAKTKVSRVPTEKAARKVGPVDEGLSGEELDAAIADSDDVQIVFSDGKKEITGIPAAKVEGEAWREHTLGKMLRDPIEVHGPAVGSPGFAIDGYGLLIDGKLVAYCKRSDQLTVAPGRTVSIADDIYF